MVGRSKRCDKRSGRWLADSGGLRFNGDMETSRRGPRVNMGRWRVLQERGAIPEDQRPPPPQRLETMGSALPSIMRELGAEDAYWQEKFASEWATVVGAAVAQHSRPGPLQNVSLTVYVTNSVWLQELKRVGYAPMLARLQERYSAGKIRHLKLVLDPDAGRPAAKR